MFGRKNADVRYGALIDVGSGSVGVGVVRSHADEKLPEVLYAHRELMRVGKDDESVEARVRRMREALFSASLRLAEEGARALEETDPNARVSHILVTCASPWAHTVTREVHYEHDDALKITRSLIADLEKSAEEQVEEDINENTLIAHLGMRIVERATVEIRLNGYRTHNPFDHEASTVTLSHIVGLIPQDVLDAVYEVQEKVFTNTDVSAHTYMLIFYCILRDLYPTTKSLSIIDVTGESTEFGIVEDGVLVDTAHVPYGSNTLIREIAAETGGAPGDIVSMLRAYDEETSSDEMNTIIRAQLKKYDAAVTETFAAINEHHRIPNTLVVTALPELQPLFEKRLPGLAERVSSGTYAALKFHRHTLEEIAAQKNTDVFVTLASRFFHKLHGCGEIESL